MLPGCWTLPIDCSRSHPLHGSSLPFPRWRRRRNSSSRLAPPGSLAVAARALPGAAPAIPAAPTPPAAGRSEDPTTPDPATTQRRRSPVPATSPRRRIPAPATTPMLNLALRSTWPMLTRAQVPVGLPKAPCIPVCRRVLACVLGHGTSAAEGASPEHMPWGVDQKEPMETLKHRVSMVNNPCDMRVQVRSRRWIPLAWTVCWQGRETSRAAGAGAAAPSIDRR